MEETIILIAVGLFALYILGIVLKAIANFFRPAVKATHNVMSAAEVITSNFLHSVEERLDNHIQDTEKQIEEDDELVRQLNERHKQFIAKRESYNKVRFRDLRTAVQYAISNQVSQVYLTDFRQYLWLREHKVLDGHRVVLGTDGELLTKAFADDGELYVVRIKPLANEVSVAVLKDISHTKHHYLNT